MNFYIKVEIFTQLLNHNFLQIFSLNVHNGYISNIIDFLHLIFLSSFFIMLNLKINQLEPARLTLPAWLFHLHSFTAFRLYLPSDLAFYRPVPAFPAKLVFASGHYRPFTPGLYRLARLAFIGLSRLAKPGLYRYGSAPIFTQPVTRLHLFLPSL